MGRVPDSDGDAHELLQVYALKCASTTSSSSGPHPLVEIAESTILGPFTDDW